MLDLAMAKSTTNRLQGLCEATRNKLRLGKLRGPRTSHSPKNDTKTEGAFACEDGQNVDTTAHQESAQRR